MLPCRSIALTWWVLMCMTVVALVPTGVALFLSRSHMSTVKENIVVDLTTELMDVLHQQMGKVIQDYRTLALALHSQQINDGDWQPSTKIEWEFTKDTMTIAIHDTYATTRVELELKNALELLHCVQCRYGIALFSPESGFMVSSMPDDQLDLLASYYDQLETLAEEDNYLEDVTSEGIVYVRNIPLSNVFGTEYLVPSPFVFVDDDDEDTNDETDQADQQQRSQPSQQATETVGANPPVPSSSSSSSSSAAASDLIHQEGKSTPPPLSTSSTSSTKSTASSFSPSAQPQLEEAVDATLNKVSHTTTTYDASVYMCTPLHNFNRLESHPSSSSHFTHSATSSFSYPSTASYSSYNSNKSGASKHRKQETTPQLWLGLVHERDTSTQYDDTAPWFVWVLISLFIALVLSLAAWVLAHRYIALPLAVIIQTVEESFQVLLQEGQHGFCMPFTVQTTSILPVPELIRMKILLMDMLSAIRSDCGNWKNRFDKEKVEMGERTQMFIAAINHEIRTPLHGMLGVLELLRETPLTPDQEDLISLVDTSSNLLLLLLNNLLDLAKMQSGLLALELSEVELEDELFTVMDIMAAAAIQKNLALAVYFDKNLPLSVYTDALRLKQIFANLLSNAVKFTATGNISVGVQSLGEIVPTNNETSHGETHLIEFLIQDTGCGIPNEYLPRLLGEEKDLDIHSRNVSGMGVGLSITKALVHLMNGELNIQSDTGAQHGTKVAVRVPFRIAKHQPRFDSIVATDSYVVFLISRASIPHVSYDEYLNEVANCDPLSFRSPLDVLLRTLLDWRAKVMITTTEDELAATMKSLTGQRVCCLVDASYVLQRLELLDVIEGCEDIIRLCRSVESHSNQTLVVMCFTTQIHRFSDWAATVMDALRAQCRDIRILPQPYRRRDLLSLVSPAMAALSAATLSIPTSGDMDSYSNQGGSIYDDHPPPDARMPAFPSHEAMQRFRMTSPTGFSYSYRAASHTTTLGEGTIKSLHSPPSPGRDASPPSSTLQRLYSGRDEFMFDTPPAIDFSPKPLLSSKQQHRNSADRDFDPITPATAQQFSTPSTNSGIGSGSTPLINQHNQIGGSRQTPFFMDATKLATHFAAATGHGNNVNSYEPLHSTNSNPILVPHLHHNSMSAASSQSTRLQDLLLRTSSGRELQAESHPRRLSTGSRSSRSSNDRVRSDTLSSSILGHATGSIEATAAVAVTALNQCTFLIVEDHPINQLLLRRLIENAGAKVESVGDGLQAVEMMRGHYSTFHAVLMDIRMPVMDGIEATRQIRAWERAQFMLHGTKLHVPIIAVTAESNEQDMASCFDVGMDGFLAKPLRRELVLRMLEDRVLHGKNR